MTSQILIYDLLFTTEFIRCTETTNSQNLVITAALTRPLNPNWYELKTSYKWMFCITITLTELCSRTSTYHIKSLQWLQNVGCLKNRGINLWSLIINTFFFFRAPFLPRWPVAKAVFMSPAPGVLSSSWFCCSSVIVPQLWKKLTRLSHWHYSTESKRSSASWTSTQTLARCGKLFYRSCLSFEI